MLIDPGGSDQFGGRFNLETGAGSKPCLERINQLWPVLSATERPSLGPAVRQERIELNLHLGPPGKFRADRPYDGLEMKFKDHGWDAAAGQHRS